ncbi:glutamate receptor ionotropic, delta-1-like [Macrobrachium nipponense]|uniref:glutamate receptor ionotropic, delta-1-like n=1 Tax=Macrobrachium nipponense TaxID=159736 RepID=UPI0030C86B37
MANTLPGLLQPEKEVLSSRSTSQPRVTKSKTLAKSTFWRVMLKEQKVKPKALSLLPARYTYLSWNRPILTTVAKWAIISIARFFNPSRGQALVSTGGLLYTIAENYFRSCSLTIFYESSTSDLALQLRLTLASWGVKMYVLEKDVLLRKNTWARSNCDGYFFLITKGEALVQHASLDHFRSVPYGPDFLPPSLWNYKAYYVVLPLDPQGPKPKELVELFNFRKTENLAILQASQDTVKIWTHILYTEAIGLEVVDTWFHGKLHRDNVFPRKFNNFHGAKVRVATFELEPFIVYAKDDSGNFVGRIGVDMQVINGLSRAKNFTVDFFEVSDDEKWGSKYPDGSWDGLMGQVFSEASDIAVCNVFIDGPRWGLIDYSFPYNYMPACFVAPSPKPLPNWQSLILPFTWLTWISIGLSALIGGFLLYPFSRLGVNAESIEFKSFSFNYLYILSSITARGVITEPRHLPLRLYVGLFWVYSLIVSTAYSANLVAFLSVAQMEPPIDTLKQLVDSGLRISGNSIWKSLFQMSTDKAVLDLVPKMELDADYHTILDRVKAGEFAFIQNRQFLELNRDARYSSGGRALIRIVEECFMSYNVALTLPRNSPLTDNLAKTLMNIFESGLLHKWKAEVVKYVHRRNKKKNDAQTEIDSSGVAPLELSHIQGIFYILGIGYFLAIWILAFEIFVRPKMNCGNF